MWQLCGRLLLGVQQLKIGFVQKFVLKKHFSHENFPSNHTIPIFLGCNRNCDGGCKGPGLQGCLGCAEGYKFVEGKGCEGHTYTYLIAVLKHMWDVAYKFQTLMNVQLKRTLANRKKMKCASIRRVASNANASQATNAARRKSVNSRLQVIFQLVMYLKYIVDCHLRIWFMNLSFREICIFPFLSHFFVLWCWFFHFLSVKMHLSSPIATGLLFNLTAEQVLKYSALFGLSVCFLVILNRPNKLLWFLFSLTLVIVAYLEFSSIGDSLRKLTDAFGLQSF